MPNGACASADADSSRALSPVAFSSAASATLSQRAVARSNRQREDTVVPTSVSLGSDQHHREGSRPLRHRLVARVLEADPGAGRHHQRRRHRRVLPEPVPVAPSRRVPGRSRFVRRADEGGPRRRHLRDGADGFESGRRGFLRGASRLVLPRRQRAAVSRRRQVRGVHQQPVLRRIPARCAARDHRALASRRIHRQQLGGARPREHLSLRQLHAHVSGEDRQGAAATGGLARFRVSRMDHVELRAADRGMGVEQPHDPCGRRARLHLGRHEQRIGDHAGALVQGSEGHLRACRHHDARSPAARRRHGVSAERRHRQARAYAARLGQAGAGIDGDVPVGSRLLPRREQACG